MSNIYSSVLPIGQAGNSIAGTNISQGSAATSGLLSTNNGLLGTTISIPGYGWNQQPAYSGLPDYTYNLRKVENGYVLKHNGKEYIITDSAQVEKLLGLVGITPTTTNVY